MKNFKTSTSLFSLVILCASVFIYSCSKDRIEPDRSLNTYSSPNTYLDSKKQDEQEFIIDTSGSGPIVGNQGTNIWIGKDILMYPNGDSVTWPFTVKLVELYTAKDMIYYQMPTVASGNILETDGEIRLRAFKNGTELVLKPACSVPILMPNSAPKNYMRVFYGFDASTYVDWTDNLSSLGVSTILNPVFATTATSYSTSIGKLGWINCGSNAGNSNSHTLSFTSTVDDLTNVAIFVYFPSTKTVMQVYNMASGLIPNGSNVKIVALGVNASGQLFHYYQTLTVGANSSIDVTLSQISDPDFTTLLNGL